MYQIWINKSKSKLTQQKKVTWRLSNKLSKLEGEKYSRLLLDAYLNSWKSPSSMLDLQIKSTLNFFLASSFQTKTCKSSQNILYLTIYFTLTASQAILVHLIIVTCLTLAIKLSISKALIFCRWRARIQITLFAIIHLSKNTSL